MKYLIAGIALAGCTVNQENRIHELLAVQTGSFPKIKDIQVVKDRFETDAFSLKLEESASIAVRSGQYPVYVLKAESIPLDERFVFARIDRVTGKIEPQFEFVALENGELEIYSKSGIVRDAEMPFVASEGFKAGYPIDYAVVSKKTYAAKTVEFIPYPIRAEGEGGTRIEAIVTHPLATRFRIQADGFSPFEKLTLVHTSGEREEESEIDADESGSFTTGLNPTILGRLGGEARLAVRRENGSVTVLDYPWGNGIEKRTWKERSRFPILFVANRSPGEADYTGFAALLD